jgi:hypothetical protein
MYFEINILNINMPTCLPGVRFIEVLINSKTLDFDRLSLTDATFCNALCL